MNKLSHTLMLKGIKFVIHILVLPVDNGAHVIDNFFLNNGLIDHMLYYNNMQNGVNLSFHSQLFLTLSVDVNCSPSSSRVYTSIPNDKKLQIMT